MRRILLLVAAGSILITSGCGWFGDEIQDAADITIPAEIPAEFTLDASQACSTAIDGIDSCDEGGTTPAPMRIALDPIEADLDVDIVEATGKPRLEDVAQRLERITITKVDWEVRDNSLSFDLPETRLYLGPMPIESHDDNGSILLTTLPSVPAATDDSGTSDVSDSAEAAASDVLQNLKMSAIPYTEPVIEQGQDVPPNGSATLKVTIHAEFVANPVSALSN